ncbi:hypothetical protein RGUI_2076 [Rhodovulum sp. P5]|uniref:EamA family transporter n=1 Tax=Rhodovulum sp. P5 TaxID=1564506 RepID=UPI0009C1F126|nr:hypothetical protein [Rhodovulum sp. P5]ARE40217.1 hypothetical protein RGUI_2076 [Rhodovulum sp. P5]
METFFWLLLATTLTVAGDFLVKVASSDEAGMTSPAFIAGALLYGAPAVAWFFLMQQHSLAKIGVFYASSTVIILALLGAIIFEERLEWRDALGIALAIAAVAVTYNQT